VRETAVIALDEARIVLDEINGGIARRGRAKAIEPYLELEKRRKTAEGPRLSCSARPSAS
jgi:hypothetical protein